MSTPTADVSVRVAWADDADAIGSVQVRAWQDTYVDVLPAEMLKDLPREQFADQWRRSIVRPQQARQRVLVALERASVRGFAAIAPASDGDTHPGQDAEITEFVVDPPHRHLGHGSRLLHATIDTMRSDKFIRGVVWLNAQADGARAFFTDQGWAPDGANRELDLYGNGSIVVKQVRLHTDLTVDVNDSYVAT